MIVRLYSSLCLGLQVVWKVKMFISTLMSIEETHFHRGKRDHANAGNHQNYKNGAVSN
jgi:hypothetical protein